MRDEKREILLGGAIGPPWLSSIEGFLVLKKKSETKINRGAGAGLGALEEVRRVKSQEIFCPKAFPIVEVIQSCFERFTGFLSAQLFQAKGSPVLTLIQLVAIL